jgi:hypothetical protein
MLSVVEAYGYTPPPKVFDLQTHSIQIVHRLQRAQQLIRTGLID